MKKLGALLMAAVFPILLAGGCNSSDSTDSLKDGLMVQYPMDGNAIDSGPAHLNGDMHGSAGTTDRHGRANGALAFDGVNDYVGVNQKHFAAANRLSISLWVKTEQFAGTNYFVMCSDFGVFSSEDTVGLAIWLPGTSNASGTVAPATWTHFVGTYDGSSIRAYINGELVDARNHPGTIADPDRFLEFGRSGSSYWAGSLDDVRIYDRVLTQAEVRELFQQ